jgi:hypothetical protein
VKEFGRPKWLFWLRMVELAVLVGGGLGLLRPHDRPGGTFVWGLALFVFAGLLWEMATPAASTTPDSITAFTSLLRRRTVKWGDVLGVRIVPVAFGQAVVLVLVDRREHRIYLASVEKQAREDLVEHIQDAVRTRIGQDPEGSAGP